VKVSLGLRFQVSERAAGRCEYCLIHEDDAAFRHEVDHVVSRHARARLSDSDDSPCSKGTNLVSVDPGGALVRLFDPRRDPWHDHFRLEGSVIQPLTPEGAVRRKHPNQKDSLGKPAEPPEVL